MSRCSTRAAALIALLLSLALLGCATTDCVPAVGAAGVTPAQVAAETGEAYAGVTTQWGGVLLESRNEPERTVLEVLGHPLDDCGRPLRGAASTGRFLIVHPGYLETADFEPGRLVTAAGVVLGTGAGQVGGAPRDLPMIESYRPRLWPADEVSGRSAGPWFSIGVGGGSGGVGGGVGILF